MPRKSKKKVTFLEKSGISGKRRGCLGGPRLPPLLPTLVPPPDLTPRPARTPRRTAHSGLAPKPTLNASWPPAPPPGRRQLLEVSQPVINSPCLTPGADPGQRRIPWQRRTGAQEKRIPAGPAQVRDHILLQRGDSERAKKEAEELHRKVLYLTRQYEDRVRGVEEVLEAVRSERAEAEREAWDVEQQNAELRSFNADLRGLIARLQTCAALPPERGRFPARAPWLRDRLATQGLILDQPSW